MPMIMSASAASSAVNIRLRWGEMSISRSCMARIAFPLGGWPSWAPTPADFTMRSASFSSMRHLNKPSAIGLRQTLPVQMNRIVRAINWPDRLRSGLSRVNGGKEIGANKPAIVGGLPGSAKGSESATADFSGAVLHHPHHVLVVCHADVQWAIGLAHGRCGSLVEPLVDFGVPIGK